MQWQYTTLPEPKIMSWYFYPELFLLKKFGKLLYEFLKFRSRTMISHLMIHICISVHVCFCSGVGVHIVMFLCFVLWHAITLLFIYLALRQVSSLSYNSPICLGWLVTESQRLTPLPSCWGYEHAPSCPVFLHGFWGSKLRSSCLCDKHFISQATYPSI